MCLKVQQKVLERCVEICANIEAVGKNKANDRVFAPAVMYAGLNTHTSIAQIKDLFEQNCPSIIQSTAQSNAYSLSFSIL